MSRPKGLLASALLLTAASLASGQSLVTSVKLGPDQIGLIKTGQGLSTRVAFSEPVKEIICGDLYDAATGHGSFVVQRGDNDVFIKPIPSKGMSNLFVKTGPAGEHVYNFDLEIVPQNEAVRVINVVSGFKPDPSAAGAGTSPRKSPAEIQRAADAEAAQMLKDAQDQAASILSDAKLRVKEIDRTAQEHAAERIEKEFVNDVLLGVGEARIDGKHTHVGKTSIIVDQPLYSFGDNAYLHYTITNEGKTDFSFSSVVLESEPNRPMPARFVQSKKENRLKPGESLTGVMVVKRKLLSGGNKVMLSLRGLDHNELARLSVNL